MTAPRQVLPGTTYLFTRRCLQRLFLLVPSDEVTQAFGYLLAVSAERYGIILHACCVLSNHYHLVLTDPLGQVPRFAQELNGNLARYLNRLYDRFETVWAPGSYSAVALQDEGSVLEKAAYTLANPVAAGLVEQANTWPGLWSDPKVIGGAGQVFERPELFFDLEGELPEEAELVLVPPRGFTAGEFRRSLEGRLSDLERKESRTPDGKRRRFLGVKKVLAQHWWEHPGDKEPAGKLNPKVAAVDKWKRMEALEQARDFLDAYRVAFEKFRSGVRSVIFPPGTYLMRVSLGAACAQAG
jgi:REP element-mobilizing transposase RayT